MRTLALLAAAASSCLAAIGNFRVLGTTATQALIAYTAPDGNVCTVQVSQSASLSPLALDVDPGTFANSNMDLSRPSTAKVGLARAIVIGQRGAALATAGTYAGIRHYSRALQAYTPYYGVITCPSTGDTLNFNFSTGNIPLGQTYGDPWLSDASHPGDQPYPEYLGESTTDSFVDPLTGALLKLVSLRSDDHIYWDAAQGNAATFITAYDQGQSYCDSVGPWTNPCGTIVTAGSGSTSIANSSGVLVLRLPHTSNTAWSQNEGAWTSTYTLDQAGVNLTGSGSSATSTNRVLNVCLSLNSGASCASQTQQVTLGISSGTQTAGGYNRYVYGTTPWILDSNPRISMQESSQNNGTDTVSGNVVTWVGGSNNWSLNWVQGGNGRLRLSTVSAGDACNLTSGTSAEYTITGFDPASDGLSGNRIDVTPAPPSGANYWCAQNFSVMIWRANTPIADGSTITLTAASMSVLETQIPPTPDNGASSGCYNTLFQGGYFCSFGGLSWINPTTGASVYYGIPYSSVPSIPDNWGASGAIGTGESANIDNTQGVFTQYFLSGISGSGPLLIRTTFNPSSITQPGSWPNGSQIGYASETDVPPYTQNWSNGLSMTNLTPQNPGGTCETVMCQMATLYPSFNLSKFPLCTAYGVTGGILFVSCDNGGDTMGWVIAFSPGDGNPADAGTAGGPRIIGATSTFNSPAGPLTPGQTAMVGRSLHALVEAGNGWIQINTHYTPPINTTGVAIPGNTTTTCASFGVVGNNNICMQIQIDNHTSGAPCVTNCTGYEPYLKPPNYQFTGAPGELRTTQLGDMVCAGSPCGLLAGNEQMMLVAKGANGLWTLQRAANGTSQKAISTTPIQLEWGSPNGIPVTGYAAGTPQNAYWNPVSGCGGSPDPNGNCLLQDNNETFSHGEWRDGGAAATTNAPAWNVEVGGWNSWPTVYQTSVGQVPAILELGVANLTPGAVLGVNYTSYSPPFAGAWGYPWTLNAGAHPNAGGALASANESIRAFDNTPIQGGSASPAFTWITGQLYVSTPANVVDADDFYGTGNVAYINRKLMAQCHSCGNHPLIDISARNSSIATDATGSYTVCYARNANECHTGSTVGQIYVNCPGIISKSCSGSSIHGGQPLGVGNDICVGNQGIANNAVRQFTLDHTDQAGAYTRTLVTATSRLRMVYGFENNRVLPDNSWLLFRAEWLNLERSDMWMAKLPPWPGVDSVARGSFVPVALTLKPPAGLAVDNALVQFGYQEYGAPQSLNCTTRNDACLANAGTVPASNQPFYFASESPAGAACGSGCTISVPAISQRILYYQVLYRAANNSVLATGPLTSTVVP